MHNEVQQHPEFTVLIDGECPLCAKEARMMARLDGGRGRLAIVDIAKPDFNAGHYRTTYEAVMGSIHGVLPDGSLVEGMEVFRRAYAAVGYGWVLAPSGWPVFRNVCDGMYRIFAKYRLRLTGRANCVGGHCRVPGAVEQR